MISTLLILTSSGGSAANKRGTPPGASSRAAIHAAVLALFVAGCTDNKEVFHDAALDAPADAASDTRGAARPDAAGYKCSLDWQCGKPKHPNDAGRDHPLEGCCAPSGYCGSRPPSTCVVSRLKRCKKVDDCPRAPGLTTCCREGHCGTYSVLPCVPIFGSPTPVTDAGMDASRGSVPSPANTPDAAKPSTRPDAAKPSTKPDAARPANTPDAAKPSDTSDAAKPSNTSDAAKPSNTSDAAKPPKSGDAAMRAHGSDATMRAVGADGVHC